MKHKKSRKNKNTTKSKTKSNNKNSKNKKKTKKIIINNIILKNKTPLLIQKISEKISEKATDYNDFFIPHLFNKKNNKTSYSPTINKEIVTLKTMPRQEIMDCNNKLAFELKEPLQIGIPGTLYGKKCFDYNSPEAKKYLLKNLAANKHLIISKIVPPIQLQANCWFNAMFATFFISDKGRKFFHYFRELMIKGKQKNGQIIQPEKLRNAFALLNFGIESCLIGNKYAYELNTNSIIHQIYDSIPKEYRSKYSYIVDVKKASNPLMYYMSIINYLNNNSILILLVKNCNTNWKEQVAQMVSDSKLPHIIVFEVFDSNKSAGDSGTFLNKPQSFDLKDGKYSLDSAVIRDKSGQHFCSTITCEHEEMGYDGMSFHRIVPLKWKDKINSTFRWKFEGSEDYDKTPLEWSFTHGYQLLMYYRV